MQDNGDGTYSYDYTLTKEGLITIQVILVANGLAMDYFPNRTWSGSPTVSSTISTLNENWGYGGPFSEIDNFSFIFTGYFQPSSTEPYNFHVDSDDSTKFTIDGQTLINHNSFVFTTSVRNA
jgi:hypothetical protein